MESYKTNPPTVAELMSEDDARGKRVLVQVTAGVLVGIGLIFTGYLNFMLYARAFPANLQILGLIPALLIEGSLAAFMLGSFVWFSAGTQGSLARIFGWAMFGIVALNCILEFNALTTGETNDLLRLYAFWGVPVIIPLVVGFWKAVLDADPSIQAMRTRRRIAQTLQMAQLQAMLSALDSEESRAAVAAYGLRAADSLNRRLRGEEAISLNGTGHDPKA